MPITLGFDSTDLLQCRFATSPVGETLSAVRALLWPMQHRMHSPWLRAMMPHRPDLAASALSALLPQRGYTPDFLSPPPTNAAGEIEHELDRIRATPPDLVAAELGRVAAQTGASAGLRVLLDDPAKARDDLADLIFDCWRRLLALDWHRIRNTLDSDLTYRAGRLIQGGLAALLADLQVRVDSNDARLIVDGLDGSRDLAGHGLLFIPSVFIWPKTCVVTDAPWQPAIIYPARGIGALWAQATQDAPEDLAALLGRTRAAVLYAIREPRSTTRVATQVGISPATASAHLTALRRAGLASAHRNGHQMRYTLSALGHQLADSRSGNHWPSRTTPERVRHGAPSPRSSHGHRSA